MNKEVKQILDYLKNEDDYIEDLGIKYKRIYINNGDLKTLLDYISNLQRERNNFKTALDESSEIIGELEEENNKLKELKKIDEELKKIKGGMINNENNRFIK